MQPRTSLSLWLSHLSSLRLWETSVRATLLRHISFSDPICSVVRGLFGEDLRRDACLTQANTCVGCLETARCEYAKTFAIESTQLYSLGDPRNVQPFWFQSMPISQTLERGFVLRPRLIHIEKRSELFGQSLLQALSRLGSPGSTSVEAPVYRLLPDPTLEPEADRPLLIEAVTPLDLRGNEDTAHSLCPQAPVVALLMMSAARRLRSLLQASTKEDVGPFEFPSLQQLRVLEGGFWPWRGSRFSHRQQQRSPLQGWLGQIVVLGPAVALLFLLLQWASRVSVGKATSIGLGELRLSWVE
jgi:hypothetical protein